MIIQLKVKTLDSRLYDFELDDEVNINHLHKSSPFYKKKSFQTTILQFKDLISEKTSIASTMQRIIFNGRVLLDEKQLKEYGIYLFYIFFQVSTQRSTVIHYCTEH